MVTENILIFKIVDGVPFNPSQGYASDHVDIIGQDRLIKFSSTIPSGWVDQTTIENIKNYWQSTGKDFRFAREVMGLLVGNFALLSPTDKATIAEWFAIWDVNDLVDYTTLVGYYMAMGYTQEQAQGKIIIDEVEILRPYLISCSPQRCKDAQKVCAMFLSAVDQDDLFKKINIPLSKFMDMSVLGLNYRSTLDGIMDFVESTGIYSASGLEQQGYTLNFGTIALFKSSLKNALVFNKFEIS